MLKFVLSQCKGLPKVRKEGRGTGMTFLGFRRMLGVTIERMIGGINGWFGKSVSEGVPVAFVVACENKI